VISRPWDELAWTGKHKRVLQRRKKIAVVKRPTGGKAVSGASPSFSYYEELRATLAIKIKRLLRLRTDWADQSRDWTESSIFDTWFRCLTIAEISQVLTDSPYAQLNWQYLSVPGLGWFNP